MSGDNCFGAEILRTVSSILAGGFDLLSFPNILEGDKGFVRLERVLEKKRLLPILTGLRGCKYIDLINRSFGFNGCVFNSTLVDLISGGGGSLMIKERDLCSVLGSLCSWDGASLFCI